MEQFSLNTPEEGFIDITGQVRKIVAAGNVQNGLCQIFVPHTTAGVTINENADPDVVTDMLAALGKMVPDLPYRHSEGNSPAHVKSRPGRLLDYGSYCRGTMVSGYVAGDLLLRVRRAQDQEGVGAVGRQLRFLTLCFASFFCAILTYNVVILCLRRLKCS